MSKLGFLIDQIFESRDFVNRLISELPQDMWYAIPENTESNFAWQIGHLMLAQNFHAITVISGRNKEVNELIPVPQYVKLFNGMGTRQRSLKKDFISPARLKKQFDTIHSICIDSLSEINDDILEEELEPIPLKHPIAKTKYEAISWCF